MEIAVSRSMSHMLWNIGADRGQLLLLCRIRNEMKSLIWTVCTFTSNIPSMLVEGGIDRKNILSNHSLFCEEFRDLLKKHVSRFSAYQRGRRIPVFPLKDGCPLCWMYCVCGVFSRTISERYGAVLLGIMSIFKTLHVSCQICMWTIVFWFQKGLVEVLQESKCISKQRKPFL